VDAIIVAGKDAGGVLAAVLQHEQAVVKGLVYRGVTENADDSAHAEGISCVDY
jgi:hypothetical protein